MRFGTHQDGMPWHARSWAFDPAMAELRRLTLGGLSIVISAMPRARDTMGRNVHDAWGHWYMLSPTGEEFGPVGGY